MAITTTYECDKCKKKVEREKLHKITVVTSTPNYSTRDEAFRLNAHWCLNCLLSMGLRQKAKESKNKPVITLEDLIREIVQEEIQ